MIAPYNDVIVNPAQIFAMTSEPSMQADDVELLAVGRRQILILDKVDQVAQQLDEAFRAQGMIDG